ncbi:PilZ domain-containing protein [Ectothiorhodospira mobilis]|uniref:PilZ domain-containing protein n=1 Tax=Ectothiorhodospira mobilis TaxID=195064 RepID=UPI001908625D|nr:PilZ domain-containing protein [Ectothiorhodospira mobilis]
MGEDDPFDSVLSIHDRLPLRWSVAEPPGDEGMARINEANESLLRVCASLDDTAPHTVEEAGELSHELQRIESKLNVLVEMVGSLLHSQVQLPPAVSMCIASTGLAWECQEQVPPGTGLHLHWYLCPHFPRPLELFARSCAAPGEGITARFEGLSPQVEDGIQKMVFRRHRRSIAQSRARRRTD